MIVPFNELPANSRLWVYQADRDLTNEEQESIRPALFSFIDQWAAHGKALSAAGDFAFNRFLVIAVNEEQHGASGCSIDASVHFIKDLGNKLNINFFDRTKVLYLDNNDSINSKTLGEIKKDVIEGNLSPETRIFNTAVTNKKDFDDSFVINIKDSWLNKWLPSTV
ncbi:hypothetical protein OO013_18710 [Mangrovivirga sp. M17]|uniref:ABC transporter ATPase n=1 Tax=Mangrovivirga halotolerans TaxID=2993936 RepID=A0ABT3RVX4_9BACT|nr:hypothetical protein [Mangrovivirga halotolerans]MCX2745919.1 hypothetical protein [Mangrovivirga halotolerans]